MAVYKTVTPTGQALAILEANGKYAKNGTGATIPQFRACAWVNNSTVKLADADDMSADEFAGVSFQAIPSAAFGLVLRSGKVPGALAGLSAVAGQPVYLSPTAGLLALSTVGFPPSAIIFRVGFAEPPDNSAGPADDLLIEFELLTE